MVCCRFVMFYFPFEWKQHAKVVDPKSPTSGGRAPNWFGRAVRKGDAVAVECYVILDGPQIVIIYIRKRILLLNIVARRIIMKIMIAMIIMMLTILLN